MSGQNAKRLFALLPPRMPLKKKYELAENIWTHFGPTSSHAFRVGADASVSEVAERVAEKLDESVVEYLIPQNIKNRFEWLSAGDVNVKEQLLNHFRNLQKELALQKVTDELPVLQNQMRENPDVTGQLKQVLEIHKHEISIWVEKDLNEDIVEGSPLASRGFGSGGAGWGNLVWWIIGGIVLLAFLLR